MSKKIRVETFTLLVVATIVSIFLTCFFVLCLESIQVQSSGFNLTEIVFLLVALVVLLQFKR